MSRLTTPIAALVLVAAGYAGARGAGPLPPLGPLLDPFHGAWASAREVDLPKSATASVPGLGAGVRVVYDDRAVPHIFAATEEDAWRALGYVVARDRLFQLDLQTRAASGRLSEIAGARAVALDREPRQLGMVRAAERKLAALDPTSTGARAIAAYADGVNAYIDAMRPEDVPVEYRLLGAKPERWRPINSVHLLNRMAWTLSYGEGDLRQAATAALVGRAAADALFPAHMPIQEPIQPNGQRAPRFDAVKLPPPGAPDSDAAALARALAPVRNGPRTTVAWTPGELARVGDALGSNNWAVAPSRSASGRALLAGDPHLDLTLPSIWYEAHLVVPGKLDVYGVTIPGAPGIIIGFNRDLAWTFTNSEADFLDFYTETVDDSLRPTRYLLDGAWRPVERRVEEYRGKAGEVVATDTVYYTHRGPMRREGRRWLSMRWTALEPSASNEMAGFADAAHARTAAEWYGAMAVYGSPPQNMLVADRSGTIAIRTTGKFPLRPGDGRGDVIRDGTRSASDWAGYRPLDRVPNAMNPAQGFLASNNQQPIDPRVDPSYMGERWADPWRAMRINALLRADSVVTTDDMRRFQTDPGSARADVFVPAILAAAQRRLARSPDAELAEAARLLGEWDRRYTRDDRRAVLFEATMRELVGRTWDELLSPGGSKGERVATPPTSVLATLLADSASAWWDDRRTPGVHETRDDILTASLVAALAAVKRERGAPDGDGWLWRNVQHANIYHLLRLESFSRLGLPVQGGTATLNPSSGLGTQGASWRMVVELGPEVHAWGTYPGGQSGNPASPRYDDRLQRWLAGELDSLRVPRDARGLDAAHTSAVLTLTPAAAAASPGARR
ncbi:MAG TPA: penicillin acylase family protein [Gemmatimonadaceae bacterium]|nr:penicillin acylase family protein [Gemmatimonadaceae bacterium]